MTTYFLLQLGAEPIEITYDQLRELERQNVVRHWHDEKYGDIVGSYFIPIMEDPEDGHDA